MKVVKIILGIVVALAAVFLIGALFVPSQYEVSRTLKIDKPAAELYSYISDFSNRQAWDPWGAEDPDNKVTISGTPGTTDYTYDWVGNPDMVGSGSLHFVEAVPNKSIHLSLSFTVPMEATSDVYWTFEPTDGGTNVTWSNKGEIGWPFSWFTLGMDDNLGPNFEKGLENIKTKTGG
jgi:hypothetical protein